MRKSQDEMMILVATEWNDLLNDVEDEEGAAIFTSGFNFTDRVKYLTFMVEAYRQGTLLHLAKLSWNDEVDGAGSGPEWQERVIAAMNFAIKWLRDKLDIQD